MNITLLRHAPTQGNVEGRYVGKTDLPLCAAGVALAQTTKIDASVTKVYTSGLLRSVQTARILYPNARQTPCPGLDEMDFGAFEGRHWREMENDASYQAWLATGCEAPCPGGEEKAAFTRRCCAAFLQILESEQAAGAAEVHIVAHGGTIMSVLSALAAPEKPYFSWKSDFCGGYLLGLEGPALTAPRPLQVLQAIAGGKPGA